LNPGKRGLDHHFHKLEIPVSVAPQAKAADELPFCAKNIDPMAGNSNCMVEYSHAFGQCQVIASL
jgi:hypothetical protein